MSDQSQLRERQLLLWLEHNALLKDGILSRFLSIWSIKDEISRISNAVSIAGRQLTEYQAAEFQGEVLNIKQENNKVSKLTTSKPQFCESTEGLHCKDTSAIR